jgi:hypothetical protein
LRFQVFDLRQAGRHDGQAKSSILPWIKKRDGNGPVSPESLDAMADKFIGNSY